jgi:hypothetical protein
MKQKTNIYDVLSDFNKLHKNLQFTLEIESNNEINCLDLTITRKSRDFMIKIHRKLTETSMVIHGKFGHPTEHKREAFNYIHNRMDK